MTNAASEGGGGQCLSVTNAASGGRDVAEFVSNKCC